MSDPTSYMGEVVVQWFGWQDSWQKSCHWFGEPLSSPTCPLTSNSIGLLAIPWTYCSSWVWVDCSNLGKKAADSAFPHRFLFFFIKLVHLFSSISRALKWFWRAIWLCIFALENVPTSSWNIKWLLINTLPHMHTHSWITYLVYL